MGWSLCDPTTDPPKLGMTIFGGATQSWPGRVMSSTLSKTATGASCIELSLPADSTATWPVGDIAMSIGNTLELIVGPASPCIIPDDMPVTADSAIDPQPRSPQQPPGPPS